MDLEEDYNGLIQDNDPKHTSRVAKARMTEEQIKLIQNYPPQSPDLNPIECVWQQLKKNINNHIPRPQNLRTLEEVAQAEWKLLESNY